MYLARFVDTMPLPAPVYIFGETFHLERCARTDNIHVEFRMHRKHWRQPVLVLAGRSVPYASILPNRFTFWSLLERKMNRNISRGRPVRFLSNINDKSTSRLLELVISLPQSTQIFSHMCALSLSLSLFTI